MEQTEAIQNFHKPAKERDFYKSLSRLADHYGIETMPSGAYEYPYNIALAMQDAREKLRKKVSNWQQLRLIQLGRKTYLISEERFDTGSTLYYIPVIPLYRMCQNRQRRRTAQLLVSVCAYLYHIADIPYYRQEDSYLYYKYEMLIDWLECDDENEYTPEYAGQIAQARLIGDRMEQKIFSAQNLTRFKDRLSRFKGKDTFDQECYLVAAEAYALYEKFPNEKIYRNAGLCEQPQDEEMENIVAMDSYISFCADVEGLLFDTLTDSVNCELQEYGQIEEPILEKRFDGSDLTGETLEFEKRLFALMEELAYLLTHFKA